MMERDWRAQCAELADSPAPELPEGTFNLATPRSRCPACSAPITALQNIPVLSYLILGGKCANCGTRISARYPIIEFTTAALSAAVAWRFGFGMEALAGVALTWTLIAISVIDIDHQLIPDSLSLPLVWTGLLLSLFSPLAGANTLFIAPPTAHRWRDRGLPKSVERLPRIPAGNGQGRNGLWRLQVARRARSVVRLAAAAADRRAVGRGRRRSGNCAHRLQTARTLRADPLRALPCRCGVDSDDVWRSNHRLVFWHLDVAWSHGRTNSCPRPNWSSDLADTPQRLRIGLTGGIASGKSLVADAFAALGVPIIDTDVIAREVVEPGQPALARIRAMFGEGVITDSGELDRSHTPRHRVQRQREARAA